MKPSRAILALAPLVSGTVEKLAGYQPQTQVTDQAAIDLDQMMIEDKLGEGRIEKAKDLYEQGGFSMSYAELLLQNPEGSHLFHKGDKVIGLSSNDDEVVGYLMDVVEFDEVSGQTIGIRVQYRTNDDQSTYVNCQVGGLASLGADNQAGCFVGAGDLSIFHNGEWFTFDYTYDVSKSNVNGRTLQMFSKNAEEEMRGCQVVCPYYDDYQLFTNYYGNFDYGDVWFQSAVSQTKTKFYAGRGDANFGELEFGSSIAQAAQKGTVTMNVWMYVVKKLEDALYQCVECNKNSRECREGPVSPLDEAAAYYVGSLRGEHGETKGKLLYDLADWAAQSMRTGGKESNEGHKTSYVNLEIIEQFTEMQQSLGVGACKKARKVKHAIVNLMKVPLIQGVIISAYKRDHQISVLPEIQESDMAEGATFVASMLPYLHECSADDAEFIFNKLKIGSDTEEVAYTEIKQVLERHYDCLGITCTHIGGIWTASGYAAGGAPCEDGKELETAINVIGSPKMANNDQEVNESSSGSSGTSFQFAAFVLIVGASCSVLIFMYVAKFLRKRRARRNLPPPVFRNIAAVSEIA